MAGKDLQVGRLFLASFLGAALVLLFILVMVVLYYGAERQLADERTIQPPYADTERALLDQRARLAEYQRVADVEEFGVTRPAYRIPIDEAMKRVLADWASGALPGKTVVADTSAQGSAEAGAVPPPAEAKPGNKPIEAAQKP